VAGFNCGRGQLGGPSGPGFVGQHRQDILHALAVRFNTRLLARGPYFFVGLDGITAADEQANIDARHLQANGITYVGSRTTRVDWFAAAATHWAR